MKTKMKLKDYIEQYGYEKGYIKLKNDNRVSKTLTKYIEKYGLNNGIDLYIKRSSKNIRNLQSFISKYGQEEGTKKYNEWRAKCKISLQSFISKYGQEEGTKRYNEWKIHLKENRPSLEKFISKYGQEEGTKRYNEWKKSLDTASLSSFISKYGQEEGTKKYNEYKINMSISVKKSLKPGIMAYINSKQFYIDHYGQEEGTKRYNEWKKSQDHGSLSFFIKKYGKIDGLKKYKETNFLKANIDKPFYSKISQELFKILDGQLLNPNDINYAIRNCEFSLYDRKNKQKYFYDFRYKQKIIEYHGDYWHANPKIYNETDLILKNRTAKDIWEYDIQKQNYAKNQGYSILVIWDSDYQYDKLKTINECLKFLTT